MIHGVGLDHDVGAADVCSGEAFCVLRYDMLGHGRSEARPVKDITPLFGNWKICCASTLQKCTWWDCQEV